MDQKVAGGRATDTLPIDRETGVQGLGGRHRTRRNCQCVRRENRDRFDCCANSINSPRALVLPLLLLPEEFTTTAGLDGTELLLPPNPNPASDKLGKCDPRPPIELELSRRNESRCCLFSLSRNFLSVPDLLERNRWPVVSILTGEILLPDDDGLAEEELLLGSEKLSDDRTA